MMDIGLLEPVAVQRVPQKNKPQTLDAWLHITNACNLRCDYCYLVKSNDCMTEQVEHACIDALVRSAVSGGFRRIKIKFAGGEPSLQVEFNSQLAYLHA